MKMLKINKTLAIVFLALAIVGFLVSTYLTIEHFLGEIPPCSITSGCETVLTSKWSAILGIPVALLGAFYFLTQLVLTTTYLKNRNPKPMFWAMRFSILGLVSAIWFISLQLFVIKEICFYCMIADITSIAMVTVGFLIFLDRKGDDVVQELPN